MARPRPPPLYLLAVVFFLLPVQPPPAVDAASPVAFSFPSFSLRNLTLLGGASLRSASVSLPPPSSHALFPLPLPFPPNASFSTSFLFASPASARPASRLSFVLLPDPLAAAEGSLGNRSLPALEVAFDAPRNRVHASSAGERVAGNSTGAVDLRNGNEVGSWVVYDARRAHLEVFLSHASLRPPTPALVVPNSTGLAARFAEFMFVGFQVSSDNGSSSVDGGFAIHSWSFQTSGLPAVNLASRPSHNVSDSVRRGPASDGVAGPALDGVAGRKDGRCRRLALGLGIPLPVLFLGAVMVFAVMSLKKWRSRTAGFNDGARAKAAGQPREFMYQDLFSATKGFNPSLVVGSGGFGTVYRAVCPRSGVTYAVKRSKQSRESHSEFTAELTIIADLKHPNLVQLQGWCAEKDELLLVYEFMSNGSLDMALHPCSGVHRYPTLSWARRYNVAVGIASAVAYLHEEHEQQICTRRRPIEREAPGSMNMLNVVDWVWNLHSKGKLLDAVDSTLDGEYDTEQMMRLLLLGLSCVNPFSEERPVMRTVLDILEGKSEPLPVPKKKPLLVFVSNAPIDFEGIVSECNQSTVSSDLFELKIDIN
ncbi:hypothetical protein ACQ4PT_067626 [Festuca glaucescens]